MPVHAIRVAPCAVETRRSWGYAMYDDPLKLESAGAAQAMVQIDGSSTWLLATANGGIWKTTDLHASPLRWKQVLDQQPVACTSISAMEAFGSTVLAGCGGATSSEMGYDWNVVNSGDWAGVLISRDGGDTWATMSSFPPNYFVTALVLSSRQSFLVAARARLDARDDGGVWATADGGATWTRTFSRPVFDLVHEPASGAVLAALPWVGDWESVHLSRSARLAQCPHPHLATGSTSLPSAH
jgi:hypothetical protein